MASLGSYLPSPGSAVWRRDISGSLGRGEVTQGNKVRHVMIKGAEIWERPSPHVVSFYSSLSAAEMAARERERERERVTYMYTYMYRTPYKCMG